MYFLLGYIQTNNIGSKEETTMRKRGLTSKWRKSWSRQIFQEANNRTNPQTNLRQIHQTRKGQHLFRRFQITYSLFLQLHHIFRSTLPVRGHGADIKLIIGAAITAVRHVKGLNRIRAAAIRQRDRIAPAAQNDIFDLVKTRRRRAIADRTGFCYLTGANDGGILVQSCY